MARPYNWQGASKINWFPGVQPGQNLGPDLLKSGMFAPVGGGQQPGAQPTGGGNPYAGIMNEFLASSQARFAADSAADAASRDAALRRYVISYGQVPDFDKLGISDAARGFLEKALNPKTRELAEANTREGTSVFARTQRANDLANRRIPANLAARGLLRSGQTGADLGEQNQAYKIQNFDQLNEMLGGVEGTIGNFLGAERARADALAQAQLQAQMAAFQNYGGDMYGDGPGGPAAPAPGLGQTVPQSATNWQGFFGNQRQTRRALNNRTRAGRM